MFKRFITWIREKFFPLELPAPVVISPQPTDIPDLPLPTSGGLALGIIVGHTKTAPGAALKGTGMNEYQYNSQVADLIKKNAPAWMKVNIIYRDKLGISGAYAKAALLGCDVVIELHFNAYNGVVYGTETLCTQDADDVDFAHLVQKATCSVFNRNGMSRGVKVISASARGGGNVHAFKQGPNCLVEPFFGDNPKEVDLALKHKENYAKALIRAVEMHAKKKDFLI